MAYNNSYLRPTNFGDKDSATAPYNFVNLPSAPLLSPMEDEHDRLLSSDDRIARAAFKDYIENGERLSGSIKLDITTLTPLFVGGNPLDNTRSFAPVDGPIIPGSSLRGMFKNIFKIVTCGAFRGGTGTLKKGEDFNDEHIYFRCLMTTKSSPPWMSDLNKLYNGRMTGTKSVKDPVTKRIKTVPVKNARPGFLIKLNDGRFMIAPSIYAHDRKDDRILIKEYEKKFGDRVGIRESRVTWQGREAYIIIGSQKPFRLCDAKSYANLSGFDKKKAGKQFIRFTSLDHVDWSREHWFELSDELRASYEHDRNRRGVNLFKDGGILKREQLQRSVKNLPADVNTLVPCHFLVEDEQLTAFGHGQCFRIPYKKRIGDAVHDKLQGDFIDFADAIFGRESFWASRVFFDDAVLENTPKVLPTDAAHPLMQPNPTSYQLYLKQNDKALNHWDADRARIRGYKLYWHTADADWHANDAERALDRGKSVDKRMTRDMSPLDSGRKFTSTIRFTNLTALELGALLTVFDLDGKGSTAAYKIGQGKPLGFGSIKVETKLCLERDDAYIDMVDDDGWIEPLRAEDSKKYLDAFKTYVKERGLNDVWRRVMKELNAMSDWSNTKRADWSGRVKSMSGNVQDKDGVDRRFKERSPLPSIFDVVK